MTPKSSARTALVLGATGSAGSAIAQALQRHGWHVRALTRSVPRAQTDFSHLTDIEWVAGDALNPREVLHAAYGVEVIIHALNPPQYKNWRGLAIPMLGHAIDAALSVGARLVMPGNVYNYSPDAGALIGEEARQEPITRKGKIRVEMEQMIASAGKLGLKSLIVRVGDFFGPHSSSSWFNEAMVAKGKPLTSVTYPGEPNIGHAWVYLPDLGETVAALLDQEQRLAQTDRFHMAGHYFERGVEMAEATLHVAGLPKRKIKNLPWIAFYLLAPFVTFMREALEMRYLWKQPIGLDNAKLVAFLGAEPRTPLEIAIRDTLVQLKCLPVPAAIQPATALTSGAKRSAATL